MKKFTIYLALFLSFIILASCGKTEDKIVNNGNSINNETQAVLENTYNISKQYISLRYKTDNVLINAKDFKNYDSWNNEMKILINGWEELEKNAINLENLTKKITYVEGDFNLINKAKAYDKKEISDIFDNAPAGKKIATLAKHLGVDAKLAFKILKQDQAQVEADAWNEAGDTFQKLETSAIVIKDGCKVAGFVGGIIITGGAAGFVGSSTLSQAAVIVNGADMILEITEDGANIALGNYNKISAIIGQGRKVTSPLANILSISDVPNNLKDGFGKFNSAILALDQFNSAAQDGKIVGIDLPVYTKDTKNKQVKVSLIKKEELDNWFKDIGVKNTETTKEEIEEILGNLEEKVEEVVNNEDKKTSIEETKSLGDSNDIVGVWEGTIKSNPSQNTKEEEVSLSLLLNKDGSIVTTSEVDGFVRWEKEGNIVKFFPESKHDFGDGNYVFNLSGDTMTFVKLEGPDSADPTKWVEVLAGSDFFGGKFYEITLNKK